MSLSNFRVCIVSSLAALALVWVTVACSGQEYATPPSGSRSKHVRPQPRKHHVPARDYGVGGVFLDFGVAVPPQPHLFSRGSYTVVDTTEPSWAAKNFVDSKPAARPFLAKAEEAFRGRSYEAALRWIQHALIEDPQNGLLDLFGAQAFFALGDYDAAADAIARALSRLPQRQWNTIVANHRAWYANDDYVAQMSRLGEFLRQHPEDVQARFVQGYHFAFLGHREAAVTDMNRVLAVNPHHRQASELVKLLNNQPPSANIPSEPANIPAPAFELLPPPKQ